MSGKQPAVATLTGALLAPKGEARPAEGGDLDTLAATPRRRSSLWPYAALFLAGAALPALAVTIWLMVKEPPASLAPTGASLASGPSETLFPEPAQPAQPAASIARATPPDAPWPAASTGEAPSVAADHETVPSLGPLNPAASAAVGGPPRAPVAEQASATDAPAPSAPPSTPKARALSGSPATPEAQPPAPPPMIAAAEAPPPAAPVSASAEEPAGKSQRTPVARSAASPRAVRQSESPPPPKPRPSALAARTSGGPGYYAQLSSVASRALVDREKRRLSRLLSRALSGRKLVVHDGIARGGATVYRIRVGPLNGRGEARRLCKAVKARRGGCLVVRVRNAT